MCGYLSSYSVAVSFNVAITFYVELSGRLETQLSSLQEEMMSLPKKEDVARMEVQLEAVTKETAAKQQVSSRIFSSMYNCIYMYMHVYYR